MQDIAGCRIIVANVKEQDDVVASLKKIFPNATVVDRREKPSFGYRAVHLTPKVRGLPVEIQVRSLLQHRWAEFSEKLADRVGSELKYGGGPSSAREALEQSSKLIASHEVQTREMFDILRDAEGIEDADLRQRLEKLEVAHNARSEEIGSYLANAAAQL